MIVLTRLLYDRLADPVFAKFIILIQRLATLDAKRRGEVGAPSALSAHPPRSCDMMRLALQCSASPRANFFRSTRFFSVSSRSGTAPWFCRSKSGRPLTPLGPTLGTRKFHRMTLSRSSTEWLCMPYRTQSPSWTTASLVGAGHWELGGWGETLGHPGRTVHRNTDAAPVLTFSSIPRELLAYFF